MGGPMPGKRGKCLADSWNGLDLGFLGEPRGGEAHF